MDAHEIETIVIEGLKEVQEISGRAWTNLTPASKPISELEGFDSLASIEATVVIEEKLGCEAELDSLFISDDGTRALTMKEICENLVQLFQSNGELTR